MTLAILGFFILLVGLNAGRFSVALERLRGGLIFLGLAFLVLGVALSTVVQINVGQVGVQTLFGQTQPRVLPPGLSVVNPLVDITRFDTRTQNYTMSAQHEEGQLNGDDAIRVLSADGLEVVIDLTVLYHVVPAQAPKILATIGEDYQDKIVRAISRTRIRDNAVYYDAVALYSTRDQLLIRNIQLPQSVKTSIESKISAEQEAQKMQFVVQKERQEADRKRVEAQGIADYQRIINAELSDKLLQYETIKANQAIATSPNAKVIIMGRGTAPQVLIGDK
jgi:regulator of protease activity HflC (stomatin/prohibitin superfamily)